MSGEFREAYGSYMHSILDDVCTPGKHPLSKILLNVYKALAPLEKAVAWVEANDSSPPSVTMACIEQRSSVIASMDVLRVYLDEQYLLVEEILRAHPPGPAGR